MSNLLELYKQKITNIFGYTPANATVVSEMDSRVVDLEDSSSDLPSGTYSNSFVFHNEAGFVVNTIPPSMGDIAFLADMVKLWSTSGRDLWVNEAGWVTKDVTLEIENLQNSVSTTTTETDARVEAIHGVEVENAPLIEGVNLIMSWGESKALGAVYPKQYFDELYTTLTGPLPANVSTMGGNYNLGGLTMDEQMTATQLLLMRTNLDNCFTNGANAATGWSLVEQANDMIRRTPLDVWESNIRIALDIIRKDSLQRYSGPNSTNPIPIPPVIMFAECGAWARASDLTPDIMLRSIELSHEIYNLIVSNPDYICMFEADNLHYSSNVTYANINASYAALALYYWRVLGKKYHPTQVREWWFYGDKAYLRCEMPHPPLQISTALVASITNAGLTANNSAGTPITISNVSIGMGGHALVVQQANSWVNGDQICGALVGTTPLMSGRTEGPRSTVHDSSPYTVTRDNATIRPLYSPLMPFRIIL